MSNLLNQLRCAAAGGGNLGRGDCDIEKGAPIGTILIPRLSKFAAAATISEAAFLAALEAGSINDTYSSRMMGVSAYAGVTPTNEAAVVETLPNKIKRRVFDAIYGFDFLMIEGMNYHKALKRTIDNRHLQYDVLEVTNQGDGTYAVWGTTKRDTSNNNVMGGIRPSSITVGLYMGNDYAKGGQFTVSISYADNNESDKNWAVMILETNPLDSMPGLITVDLLPSSSSATAVHVQSITQWGKNLIDSIPTGLAQSGLWVATNRDIGNARYGNAITIASVANDSTGTALTLAATGTDPDNPGSGKNIGISWVAPSVADALTTPVSGLEAPEVIVTLG